MMQYGVGAEAGGAGRGGAAAAVAADAASAGCCGLCSPLTVPSQVWAERSRQQIRNRGRAGPDNCLEVA